MLYSLSFSVSDGVCVCVRSIGVNLCNPVCVRLYNPVRVAGVYCKCFSGDWLYMHSIADLSVLQLLCLEICSSLFVSL